MRKYKKWLVSGTLFLGIVLLFLFYTYGSQAAVKEEEREHYSVILYQYTDNGWQLLDEGIRQAEEDFGVEVNVVTMAKDDRAKEQQDLIEREIENGAQGILVAAVDSEELREQLLEIDKKIPVVTIENYVDEKITHIGADDYQIGFALGQKILKDYETKRPFYVTVIKEYLERASVQKRYEGLMDALKTVGGEVRVKNCKRGEGDYDLALFLGKEMSEWNQDVIVALDKYTLEQSIEARRRQEAEMSGSKGETSELPMFYGIGNTEKTVDGLDDGSVKAMIYQNEFNMGYQGLEVLINKKKNMPADEIPVIRQQIVEKDTLYETENQRLLFPIF